MIESTVLEITTANSNPGRLYLSAGDDHWEVPEDRTESGCGLADLRGAANPIFRENWSLLEYLPGGLDVDSMDSSEIFEVATLNGDDESITLNYGVMGERARAYFNVDRQYA